MAEAGGNHWAFGLLKELASDVSLTAHDLEDLKNIFSKEIGSVRKADRISNINQLINCLERHDELSEYNISPLQEIADRCGSINMRHAVAAYQTPKETTHAEPINLYKEARLADELRKNCSMHKLYISDSGSVRSGGTNDSSIFVNPPTLYRNSFGDLRTPIAASRQQLQMPAALTERKRSAIYKRLSECLGTSWRNFGRELQLGEGSLDEIEVQFPREIKSRVIRLLQIFEEDERNDPQKTVFTLLRALDGCRRKDLRREVEDIMSH